MTSTKRRQVVQELDEYDLAGLEGNLQSAILWLTQIADSYPETHIGCENNYDGYRLYLYQHRPENNDEYGVRKHQEKIAREAAKLAADREVKRQEKRQQIKQLQKELSQL